MRNCVCKTVPPKEVLVKLGQLYYQQNYPEVEFRFDLSKDTAQKMTEEGADILVEKYREHGIMVVKELVEGE